MAEVTKDVYISSGTNYFWLVYKSLHNFNVNIRTDDQGQLAGRAFKKSEDWCYDYMDYVSDSQSKGYIDITATGVMSSGDTIHIDALGSSVRPFNPLEEYGVSASLYSVTRSGDTDTKWRAHTVSNNTDEWNLKSSSFYSNVCKQISASGNTLPGSMISGGSATWYTSSETFSPGDTVVFSVYIKPSGGTRFINANNGINLEIDEWNGSSWIPYSSRCFLPSGKSDFTRCSFAHDIQNSGALVRAGVDCTGTNTHGPSYNVLLSGYKFEKLITNQFPIKGRPTPYIGTGNNDLFTGYQVQVRSNTESPSYISNISIEDGIPGNNYLQNIEKYNDDNSFNINHTSLNMVSVLKNTANKITNEAESGSTTKNISINKPLYCRPNSTIEMSFRYKAKDLVVSSGGGISYGYEEWTDVGEHSRTVILGSGISSNSNFNRESSMFINIDSPTYMTPFIVVSGCVGSIFIDDIKFIDLDTNARKRNHPYDSTRSSYNLKLNSNYQVVENIFHESLGGIIWKNASDDIFIQDTISIDKAPNWNFIWREDLITYPNRNPVSTSYYNSVILPQMQAGGPVSWDVVAYYNSYNQAVYGGFQDHAEEINQTTYIDSITMDEDYVYVLYHTNSVLNTKGGVPYNKEFRANPNRYYLARGVKGDTNYDIIRLNDGLTRDISLNDGKFFISPVWPARNLTDISWSVGDMTDDGDPEHPAVSWRSQIYDIATHPNSAFVFYCGTYYWWNDEQVAASQYMKSANFIGAIPKSFPDKVGQINVTIGTETGAIEKQYGVTIYASGNLVVTPSGLHPGEVDVKRYVGLACTGELLDGADIHSLIVAESEGNNNTNVNLKLLTHSAYDNILDVEFGNFAYANGPQEPEVNYNAANVNIADIMQITDVTLPNKVYNGMINYPSGASVTPFHMSYNDKNKMLYTYTQTLGSGADSNKFSIIKEFNQWSFDNNYYYDNNNSQDLTGEIGYKIISISGDTNSVESYTFPILYSGFSSEINKVPMLVFFDYQSDYVSYIDSSRIINDEETESLVGSIKTLYRTSFFSDGQNLISKHADGSKGFKKQTEYINDASFEEPIVYAVTKNGDKYVLSSTPLTSGTFNNIKITKDYTINYLTGEITYNKIPVNTSFDSSSLTDSNSSSIGYYTILSGQQTNNSYDDELTISYSNRYTIPFSWAADESVVEFLEKIANADSCTARIDNDGNILYGPEDFSDSTSLSSDGYQAISNNGLIIKNLGLKIDKNEGPIKNALFDEISPTTFLPIGWKIKSYGNGAISTTSDISKFSRRSVSIVSSGNNFVGKVTSTPLIVAGNTEYTSSIFYNSFNTKSVDNYILNNILESGSLDGWTSTCSDASVSMSSRNSDKYSNTLKIILNSGSTCLIEKDEGIYVDEYETLVYSVSATTSDNNVLISGRLLFSGDSNIQKSISDTYLLSNDECFISVTGSSYNTVFNSDFIGIIPNIVYPSIYLSGSSDNSIVYITDMLISGERFAGPRLNVFELNSNLEQVSVNSVQLKESTFGFTKIENTFTTGADTKYILIEPSLKYSSGTLLVDGVRNDIGNKSDNFVIGDTLLTVSDFPIGQTSFTKDYKGDFDYTYDIQKSVINLASNNIIENGYFYDYDEVIPNAFYCSITGASTSQYPLLLKTSGGYFNDNSIRISMSGTGCAEIVSTPFKIDNMAKYTSTVYYKAISGDSVATSNYLDDIKLFNKVYYYDEDGNLIYEYNENE